MGHDCGEVQTTQHISPPLKIFNDLMNPSALFLLIKCHNSLRVSRTSQGPC